MERVTPDKITTLQPNEIFVFGSNLSGIHGGGAAFFADNNFGAIWGRGVGIQGQSYAIPTKSKGIERALTIDEITPYVNAFVIFANANKDKTFLVTAIGTGLAGIKESEIAPLFTEAIKSENIYLPKQFIQIIKQL